MKQLTLVGLIGTIDERLSDGYLAPIDSEIDGWLYTNVHTAIDGYVMSKKAADFGNSPQIIRGLRTLLVDNLARMESIILRERKAYRKHKDGDELLTVVLPTIRNVLTFAANLLGHCSFTGKSPFDEENVLKSALDRGGLTAWFTWYQDHLERFHGRAGKWESFDEFLAFNIHVERLLYSIGVFPWDAPDGLTIAVPFDSRVPFRKSSPLFQYWMQWKKREFKAPS